MQIFILDKNIEKNAQYYVDRHVCKIQTEIAQILSTVYHLVDYKDLPEFLYKPTHQKHPCVLWVKEDTKNFIYTCLLGLMLHEEYNYRYINKKYKREKMIFDWALSNIPKNLPCNNGTPFAQAMPDKYKSNDVIKSYRDYYINEKSHLFRWTNSRIGWSGPVSLQR